MDQFWKIYDSLQVTRKNLYYHISFLLTMFSQNVTRDFFCNNSFDVKTIKFNRFHNRKISFKLVWLIKRSFIKRQTSGTSSDNEWQRMTTIDNEWYNEWQQMTASDNEWYNEWQRGVQRVTTNDNEWQRVVQQVTKSDKELYKEWQRVTTNSNEWQRVTALVQPRKTTQYTSKINDCRSFNLFKGWMAAIRVVK